jgi:hypothetical protein
VNGPTSMVAIIRQATGISAKWSALSMVHPPYKGSPVELEQVEGVGVHSLQAAANRVLDYLPGDALRPRHPLPPTPIAYHKRHQAI